MYHTGSTAVQDVLTRNPPELRDNGIYFTMSMDLTYALHAEISPKLPLTSADAAETLFARAVREANKNGAHTLVLSHEGITYNPYYRSLTYRLNENLTTCLRNAHHIRRRLRDLTRNVDVQLVFCPRRQDHWINSNFCNAVYVNAVCGITHAAIEDLARHCLQYHTLMQGWGVVFGHENILIRPYEKAQMPHGSLYDFCEHVLHCPVPSQSEYTTNVTPGRNTIRVYEDLNPYFDLGLINRVVAGLDNDASASLLLNYKQRHDILQRYAEENKRLAEDYLGREQLFFEEAPQEKRFPLEEHIIPRAQRPRLIAHVKHALAKEHWHVDDGLLFHALGLPQPSENTPQLPAVMHKDAQEDTHVVYMRIPHNNTAERLYAIRMLLCEWLGLSVQVTAHDGSGYYLCDQNNRPLIYFCDELFADKADGQWLNADSLPKSVAYIQDEVDKIPVFYGKAELQQRDDVLYCGADVLGMLFFMLTRFEECLCTQRDVHKRLPSKEHFVVQQGLEQLPLVDIWAAWLSRLLRKVGVVAHPQGSFRIHLTHDLDFFEQDDSLLWMARADQEVGCSAVFNVMGVGTHALDGNFALDVPETRLPVLHSLVHMGHSLGFHPGMDSWVNPLVWQGQYASLQPLRTTLSQPMKEGRQHYLRYALPFTWKIWDEQGMERDTGVGFPEFPGFRCGTGRDFPVFDVLARRPLSLLERPLIVMDASAWYMHIPLSDFFSRMDTISKTARAYNTPITVLFHNPSFSKQNSDYKQRRDLYAQWLNSI